jgi:hypothetical protein
MLSCSRSDGRNGITLEEVKKELASRHVNDKKKKTISHGIW